MFGYVRPRKDELKLKDYDLYRAAYCGLCRALGRSYGFAARFLVNYDMTFLYLLRSGTGPSAAAARCFCPARVVCRKTCIRDDEGYDAVAAMTVILCVHKLNDNIRDSGLWRRMGYRLIRGVLGRAYRRACRRQPDFDALCRRQLDSLSALEAAHSSSMDAPADAFAVLLRGCADDVDEPSDRRAMQTLLYQIGRFIYLADALDDLPEDCRTGGYNPLRFRFSPEDGRLKEEDLTYLTQLTDVSVNLAGAALNLIDLRCHRELLENIIYLGLPAVFASVKQGCFQAGAKL